MRRVVLATALAVGLVASAAPAGATARAAAHPTPSARSWRNPVQRAMNALVKTPGGPPGVIVIVQRGDRLHVRTAGERAVGSGRRIAKTDRLRIASVSKAYSGAVALGLVDEGLLALDDTIGHRLSGLPASWAPITLRQLLQHTSGLPDFPDSQAFIDAVTTSPTRPPSPRGALALVTPLGTRFPPGSQYHYSNVDNFVVALMVEAATGRPYAEVLRTRVLDRLRTRHTELPPIGLRLDRPYVRGYVHEEGALVDASEDVAWGGWGWASGGIVSDAAELNRFVRAYVGGSFFGPPVRAEQRSFVHGSSSPPGPGSNSAGLALFRYEARCGTVYGHTGSIPGYLPFIAASADGSRSVVVVANASLDLDGKAFSALQEVRQRAVCEALR